MAGSKAQKTKQTKKSNNQSSNKSRSNSQKSSSQRKSIRVTEGSGNKKEISAIIVIGVCILLIISLFGGAGVVGKLLQNVMLGFFGGIPSCFILITIIVLSISVLRGLEKKIFSTKRIICLALFVICCSALIQTLTNSYSEYIISSETGFINAISFLWTYKPAVLSGGIIGGGLSFILQKLLDKLATLIVLGVTTIVLTNILFSFSIVRFIKKCASFTGKYKNKVFGLFSRIKEEKKELKASEGKKSKKSGNGKNSSYDYDDFEDEFDENTSDTMVYQELPYNESRKNFDFDHYFSETLTEDGEIVSDVVNISDNYSKESIYNGIAVANDDSEEQGKSSADADSQDKNDTEVIKKEQIHVPGTVADKSLDGLVFSKPSVVPYRFPTTDLLDIGKSKRNPIAEKTQAEANARKLEAVMKSFGIEARVSHYSIGPTVTRYEMIPNIGVRVNKIKNLTDDIALNLAASSIRIEAPIPGKSAIGIEVPNKEVKTVYFREIIESDAFRFNRSKLAACLGSGISGEPVVVDLAKMPHLMIAGTTGSGKSVCTNGIIMSMLFNASPEEVKMILIDPKMVEFSKYNGIPHLLLPVVTEPKKAAAALSWAVDQMEKRYKLLAMYGVRDLKSYNQYAEKNGLSKMPAIVIIIDELADLMMVARDSVEQAINRIAQKARAAGMHLVVATQRPSVDIITGLIKSNIPVRIALKVSSQVDSRTIIDVAGAEKLLGRGDMLYSAPELSKSIRIQGAYVSDSEIENVVELIKKTSSAEYAEDVMQKVDEGVPNPQSESTENEGGSLSEDEILFRKAVKLALDIKKISASMIQRKFSIGFNRAARIIDMMEDRGIISSADGSKPRQIIIDSYDFGDDSSYE